MNSWKLILCRILVVSLSLCAGLAALAGQQRTESIDAEKLTVRNLIGEIQVESHSGGKFEVTVDVQGDDATEERVGVVVDPGRSAKLEVRFPLDESKNYVYPRINGRSSFSIDDNAGWLSRLFGGGDVTVRGSGRGLEIWADVTIRVPEGKALIVEHGVGTIEAHGLDGNFELFARSGSIEASDIRGYVMLDTGSGSVVATDIEGELIVDTGSGAVSVTHVQGPQVNIDTGSGSVTLTDADCESVMIDTGSGRVMARGISADRMTIDTGSGAVIAELVRMGGGKFEIDTGSGSIDFVLPLDASADIEADTGSGRVKLDVAGAMRIRSEDDDSVELTVGGGEARVRLDAGSGSIRIKQ